MKPDTAVIDWSARGGMTNRVAVNAPSRAELLDDLETRLAQGRGFTVATLNLDHLVKLERDAAFRDATAPANAARFAFVRCPRAPYTAALALPTTFQIR